MPLEAIMACIWTGSRLGALSRALGGGDRCQQRRERREHDARLAGARGGPCDTGGEDREPLVVDHRRVVRARRSGVRPPAGAVRWRARRSGEQEAQAARGVEVAVQAAQGVGGQRVEEGRRVADVRREGVGGVIAQRAADGGGRRFDRAGPDERRGPARPAPAGATGT